jgi:hypothetical protein
MQVRSSKVAVVAGIIASALSFPCVTYSQQHTIPEVAAASREKVVNISTMADERVTPLADLTSQADLVVDARLVRPHSYLSADRMSIYTDYEIVPSRVVRTRIGDILTSETPGQQGSLRLTVPGGQLTVADKTVISSFAMTKPIKVGNRYLIFASRVTPTEKRFVATGGSGGVFQVLDNGRLDPLLKTSQSNPDFKDASVDDITKKVQAAPSRSR